MDQLEGKLAELFAKAPHLPPGTREFIVKIAPWVDLVLLIILLPAILFFLGVGVLLAPFGFLGGFHSGSLGIIGLILSGVSIIMYAIAIPGLFKRLKSAWNLNFYAAILGAILDLIYRDLFGLVVGTLITLYILFEIRSYYSGSSSVVPPKP